MSKRLDVWLVELGFARSRHQAQELIENNLVSVKNNVVEKPSQSFSDLNAQDISLQESSLSKYVSRGGVKLESALRHLNISPTGWTCLDLGQSTGGFTDCLLHFGATKVIGVDVGQGRVAEKIKSDPRVEVIEKLHVKDLSAQELSSRNQPTRYDLVVADLSFISLEHVISFAVEFLNQGSLLLALVKPQFELTASDLNKSGVVRDSEKYEAVRLKMIEICNSSGLSVEDYFESGIKGKDGNREFFVCARKKQ